MDGLLLILYIYRRRPTCSPTLVVLFCENFSFLLVAALSKLKKRKPVCGYTIQILVLLGVIFCLRLAWNLVFNFERAATRRKEKMIKNGTTMWSTSVYI